MSAEIAQELENVEARMSLLRESELFKGLDDGKLRLLAKAATVVTYGADQIICAGSTVADAVFVLRLGICRLASVRGSDALTGLGYTFGDSAIFDPDRYRTASIKSVGTVVALKVPYATIQEHAWAEVLPIVGHRLVRLLRQLNVRLEDLWAQNAEQRLGKSAAGD